jgi:hypothetical protein
MKWIGQHIWDFISRFRSDVYLEDLSTSTETDMLVVNSNGKITKRAIDAIDVDVSDFMTNGVDNRVLTATGADAMNAEANLTFDGSTLSIEADSNTTQHALYIDADSLTTGAGIRLDVNDALTATNAKSLSQILYRKSGVIGATNTSDITGLEIALDDNAANNGLSAVNLKGIDVKIDYDNAAGAQRPVGVKIEVAKDGTIDTLNGKGTGWETTVNDGGLDFKCYSSANDHVTTGDWSSWGTTANGATTITTNDHSGTDAHFEIAADGNITLDSAALTNIESVGLTTVTSAGVEIANGSSSGATAMYIGNADADQRALYINADNTTADIVQIYSDTLTSGNAIEINIDDSVSDTNNSTTLVNIDYDKTGNMDASNSRVITGLNVDMTDNATANSGSLQLRGIYVDLDHSGTGGSANQYGMIINGDGGDTNGMYGILFDMEDGATDMKFTSTADSGDYATWKTTTHGATTITTVDDDATAAHFEIAADGNITLDAAGDIALECGGGDLTCDADTVTFESATADSPQVIIRNTANDNQAARLLLMKDRGNPMLDNDRIAEIEFFGEDASGNSECYGKIMCQALETGVDGGPAAETGKIRIQVAEHDGTLTDGVILTGQNEDGEIDVTIGAGAASTTTVAGDLAVTTGLILDSVDVTAIQTATEVASSFGDNDTSLLTAAAIDDRIRVTSKHVLRCNAFYTNGNWVQNSLYFGNNVGNNPWNWNDPAAVGGAISSTSSFTIIGDDENWGIVLPVDVSKIEVQCSLRPSGTPGTIDFSLAVYTGVRSTDSDSDLTLTKIGHKSVSFNSSNQRYKQNDLTGGDAIVVDLDAGTMIYVGVGTEDAPNGAKNARGYMNITITER